MFIATLSTIAKAWKEPKCPSMDEWIKKMWYIYTMEYYLAIKKNEILPFATTWMELEGIMLSEIRERQNSYDFTHMRTLKDKTGAPGWRSRLSVRLRPGHELAVREFEPRVGLWADGSEPGACFRFCVSLSLCPSPVHALSLSVPKINKR